MFLQTSAYFLQAVTCAIKILARLGLDDCLSYAITIKIAEFCSSFARQFMSV